MHSIVINNRPHYFEDKEDFQRTKFQGILGNASRDPCSQVYCSCQGTGCQKVGLIIVNLNGKFHVRHDDYKPHNPTCPLYLDPLNGSQSDPKPLSKEDLSDDPFITVKEFNRRSEIMRSAFAGVARRVHDRLAWESFSQKHAMANWSTFQEEVKKEFYNLPTVGISSMVDYLNELNLYFFCAFVKESEPLTRISYDNPKANPIHLHDNPTGWGKTLLPTIPGCGLRGALDYCQIYGRAVGGPYLLLGLLNANRVITRSLLLPVFASDRSFCLVESNQERLLAGELVRINIKNWIKPADSGIWADNPIAANLLHFSELPNKLPRMDFIAKIGHKYVIIEHFGMDNPDYNRLTKMKFQFAYEHYLPQGFYYWESVNSSDSNADEFKIHEHRSNREHEIFNLNEINLSRYASFP